MAKTGRIGWRALMVVAVLIAESRISAHGQAQQRVRAEDEHLNALIRQAIEQSATFRSVVEGIQGTNGIVYVIRGRCGHHLRACLLLWMAPAGPDRMLRVVVDDSRKAADIDTMASLGHELRHALEVLTETNATTGAGMFQFYRHSGGVKGVFETEAAIEAGDAVSNELKRRRAN